MEMEEENKYSVLMQDYDEKTNTDNVLYIVLSSDIDRNEPVHDTFWRGQRWSCSDAGDYSLYNRDGGAASDMIEAGVKIFGESFRDLEYDFEYSYDYCSELDCNFAPTNLEEINLQSREEEIKKFLHDWEKENAEYVKGDSLTYWNGSNHHTISIGNDGDSLFEVPNGSETYNLAMSLWNKSKEKDCDEWIQGFGKRLIHIDGYSVIESSFESDFEIVRIEKDDTYWSTIHTR